MLVAVVAGAFGALAGVAVVWAFAAWAMWRALVARCALDQSWSFLFDGAVSTAYGRRWPVFVGGSAVLWVLLTGLPPWSGSSVRGEVVA